MFQLVFVASRLIAVSLQEECGFNFSVFSEQVVIGSNEVTLKPSLLRLDKLRSLSLSTQGKFSSSLTNLVDLPWTFFSMSISFL